MGIDVRVIQPNEVEAFVRTIESAFGSIMRASDIPRFESKIDIDRMHAAFDGDQIVGTAGVYPFDLTIPGGEINAAGVTMVGVLPTHRRKGILRAMMRTQLDDMRSRNESIAILWASEEIIYQRFGYGLSANHGRIDIERAKTNFLNDDGPRGQMRLVSLDEALKIFPSIYDRVRKETPGFYARSAAWWEAHSLYDPEHSRHGKSPNFHAVLELDGKPEGFVVYRIKQRWGDDGIPQSRVEVGEAIATSPLAIRELWRYVFGIDLVERIHATYLPADFPLLYMLSEPRHLRFALGESLWLRIVDVGAALSQRSYEAADPIVFEVTDAFCPWNEGRWRLDPSSGTANRTEERPDLALDVTTLGACYLGGNTFTQLAGAGRIQENGADALAHADAAFRVDRAPWCPENF